MIRSRNWWLPLIALVTLVTGSLLNLERWLPPHLIGEITNALHYPSGIVLALIVGPLVRHSRRGAWGVWVGGLALFAVIEWVQPYFDRRCTFADWLQSSLGMSLGLIFLQLTPQSPVYMKRLLVRVGIVLAVVFMVPLFHKVQTLDAHQSRFPVLFTFEEDSDLLLWNRYEAATLALQPHGGIAQEFGLSDQHFARVNYGDVPYPAIAYHTVRADWRGFRQLCLDARGDQPDQILRVKLRDVEIPGKDMDVRWQFDNPVRWHRICIDLDEIKRPTGEPFDLAQVHSLQLIAAPRKTGGWFDIDNLRLVR